jgi:hypothetical protein
VGRLTSKLDVRLLVATSLAFVTGCVSTSLLSAFLGDKIQVDAFSLIRNAAGGTTYAVVWMLFVPLVRKSRGGAVILGTMFPVVVAVFVMGALWTGGLISEGPAFAFGVDPRALLWLAAWLLHWWYVFLPLGSFLGLLTWALFRRDGQAALGGHHPGQG